MQLPLKILQPGRDVLNMLLQLPYKMIALKLEIKLAYMLHATQEPLLMIKC